MTLVAGARCSSATIEMMIPTGNGQTTAAIIFFLVVGHWIPSHNKHSNKALWDVTPAPLQDYLLSTSPLREGQQGGAGG